MKIHNYYLARILDWIYFKIPMEKLFVVDFFSGYDGVFMEIKSKRQVLKEIRCIGECKKYINNWISDHISIDLENKTFWLYDMDEQDKYDLKFISCLKEKFPAWEIQLNKKG